MTDMHQNHMSIFACLLTYESKIMVHVIRLTVEAINAADLADDCAVNFNACL
jgi:hypothetical protein